MSKMFRLRRFDRYAKTLAVAGPKGLALLVDWDDVDHEATAVQLQKMFRILNDHWNDPAYTQAAPEGETLPLRREDVADEEADEYWEQRHEQVCDLMEILAEEC